MWRTVPLLVELEKAGEASQWRLTACSASGEHLCSKVYPTMEAAAAAERELADLLRGLDESLVLRALAHWVRTEQGTAGGRRD